MRIELIIPQILWGVLLPAVVAGLVILLGGRRGAAAIAAGVALGHAAGVVALWGRPPFPPIDFYDWIFWSALGAAVAAAIPLPSWARRLADAAIAAGFAFLLLQPMGQLPWSPAVGAAVLFVWWPLERLSSGAGARFASVVLWGAPTALSIALVFARNSRLGQQAGMLAATVGAAAVLAWVGERVRLGRGSLGPYAVVLAGLGSSGIIYKLWWVSALLIGLAPIAAFGARALVQRRRPGTAPALTGLALEALLLATAVGIEVARAPASESYY